MCLRSSLEFRIQFIHRPYLCGSNSFTPTIHKASRRNISKSQLTQVYILYVNMFIDDYSKKDKRRSNDLQLLTNFYRIADSTLPVY